MPDPFIARWVSPARTYRATTVSPSKLFFVRCCGELPVRIRVCYTFLGALLSFQMDDLSSQLIVACSSSINSAWNRSSAIVTLDSFRSHIDLPSCNLIAPFGCARNLDIGCCVYSDDINMIDLYSSPTSTRCCCNIFTFHSSRRCKPLHRKLCEFRISNTARIRFASHSIVVPKVLESLAAVGCDFDYENHRRERHGVLQMSVRVMAGN